jgi:hypothetical protein
MMAAEYGIKKNKRGRSQFRLYRLNSQHFAALAIQKTLKES